MDIKYKSSVVNTLLIKERYTAVVAVRRLRNVFGEVKELMRIMYKVEPKSYKVNPILTMAQSAGSVECNDFISADG